MEDIRRTLRNIPGAIFLTALASSAVGFAALILIGSLFNDREDDIGIQRLLCVAGIEKSAEACPRVDSALDKQREILAVAEAELERVQDQLESERKRVERLNELDARSDSYTLFNSENLPGVAGVEVVAGSVYASILKNSRPASTFCYVTRTRSGVSENLNIASNGKPTRISEAQAQKIGLSQAQLETARKNCRYVHEERS